MPNNPARTTHPTQIIPASSEARPPDPLLTALAAEEDALLADLRAGLLSLEVYGRRMSDVSERGARVLRGEAEEL